MTATDLLADLGGRGIRLAIGAGGELRCHAPRGTMTSELAEAIRTLKHELLARLSPPDGVAWRAEAMQHQVPDCGPVPLLVAVPGLPPTAGRCFSCYGPIDADGASGRCPDCCLAVQLTLNRDRSTGTATRQ